MAPELVTDKEARTPLLRPDCSFPDVIRDEKGVIVRAISATNLVISAYSP